MTDTETNGSHLDTAQSEDARICYQVAVNLISYVGDQQWARSNVMLLANSVILAAISLRVTDQPFSPSSNISLIVLSIIGLILCVTWAVSIQRGFEFQTYYFTAARELEECFRFDIFKTLSRAGTFSNGDSISFRIGGQDETKQMSWLTQKASTESIIQIVIWVFVIVYMGALLQAVFKI